MEENDLGCTKETEPRAAMQPGTVELTPFQGEMRQEALQRKAADSVCGILPMLGKRSNMRSCNGKQHLLFLLCESKNVGAGTSQTLTLSNIYVYSYVYTYYFGGEISPCILKY